MRALLSCVVAGLLFAVGIARADEETVPLAKVPKPIMSTVKARFPEAEVSGAAKETEDGKLVYEVTLKLKGQNIDVTLSPEGELLMIEKTITAKDLPAPTTKALENKYPKATYKIVEEIVKVEKKAEKLAYYEVLLVTGDKKLLEVQVTADGKIVNEERKTKEEDKN